MPLDISLLPDKPKPKLDISLLPDQPTEESLSRFGIAREVAKAIIPEIIGRPARLLREEIPSELAEKGFPLTAGTIGTLAEITPLKPMEMVATAVGIPIIGKGTQILAKRFPALAKFLTQRIGKKLPEPTPVTTPEPAPVLPKEPAFLRQQRVGESIAETQEKLAPFLPQQLTRQAIIREAITEKPIPLKPTKLVEPKPSIQKEIIKRTVPEEIPPVLIIKPQLENLDKSLIDDLTGALKEAKPLRGKQEELFTKARAEKIQEVLRHREAIGGEKGFFAELGALKGELPKISFEPLRGKLTQEKVDRLFDIVRQTKVLDDFEKISAQDGLHRMLEGILPQRAQIDKLSSVFGKNFTEALLQKRPEIEKMVDIGLQLYNLPRSFMAGFGDLSGTLMQNIMFAYRHPLLTAKNFGQELKFFASEKAFQANQKEIIDRPTFELMKRAKINFTELGGMIGKREEQFMASLAENIPIIGSVIKATGRAWTGFLNRMRADVFDLGLENAKNTGVNINDPRFLKTFGEFVNAGTGRGNLGILEKSMPVISQALFSARKLAATFNLINPNFYVRAHPFVRKEALKTWTSFLAGGSSILAIAKMNGAEIGDDPTSADFGKIKIGNTRFNVFGTYQQVAVLLARLYKGSMTSSVTGREIELGEGFKPTTKLDIISRFFETKQHPTLSLIFDSLRGEQALGLPFDLKAETLERFIPMVISDGYDLYKEHGNVGLWGIFPTMLGLPSQTYGRQIAILERTPQRTPKIRLRPVQRLSERIMGIPDREKILPEIFVPPAQIESEQRFISQKTSQILQKINREEISPEQARDLIKKEVLKSKERLKKIVEESKK